MMPETELPGSARVVIVGGGVIGSCLAWSLAQQGCSDVVLIERGRLGCGTSWHSAGNIIRMNTDPSTVEIFSESRRVIDELAGRHSIGWRRCGRVMLARTEARLAEIERIAEILQQLGVETRLIDRDEIAGHFPMMNVEDIAGAIWSPGDGRVDPTSLIEAYAREAREAGVEVLEGVSAREARIENGRVRGLKTDAGDIDCEVLVNCCGLWAREFGLRNEIAIPLYAVEHFYLLTETLEGVYPEMPTFRDPDGLIYGREEVGGLLLGCFDRDAIPIAPEALPQPFEFGLLNENWDQFDPYLEQGIHRIPALAECGIRALVNGPEAFTPDAEPHMDSAPGIDGYFVLAGLSSTGVTRSGGMAAALARWILEGDPGIDVDAFSLRRFRPEHNAEDWLRQAVRQVPAGHFNVES